MRFVRSALICGALSWCGRVPATAHPQSSDLALHECRLEHPLHLSSLPARCGTYTVAEDPARPLGARIQLNVAVVPALNRRLSAPPLFLLAGGPGQSAIDLYTGYAAAFARINRSHDIVLLEQRGTGRSSPLACQYPDDWQQAPDDAAAAVRAATTACLARLGDRVRFYTTTVAVDDLDRVRKALGYGQIELYGSSYGTRVAELYMRRHHDATRAVILDGATYSEQAIGQDTPADGERALDLIVARCLAAADCGAAFPQLRKELSDVRSRFGPDTQALTLPDPSSGAPLNVDFNRGMLNAALRFLSYSAVEAALLPMLVHEAAGGTLAPIAAQTIMMSRQVGSSLASGMQNSVICSEDVPFYSLSELERQRMALTYQGSDQVDALRGICRIWPKGPVDADLHQALHSDIPTLLLSGEADPVTPPASAERAARGLTRHRHLILTGAGHGQLATGCVPRLMAQFLDDSRPDDLDATCLDHQRPAPFFVDVNGPAP